MEVKFNKYQGTGNDFIMIDNRSKIILGENQKLISNLCDRKFGIGADGLILIEDSESADFKMVYFNADGRESTLCGNGSRCAVAFAKKIGLIGDETFFEAIDGGHSAHIEGNEVALKMNNVEEIEQNENYLFLDTGSPHHIELVEAVTEVDVFSRGEKIRNGAPYFEEGSNVNFVERLSEEEFSIRTYERGVENETLSCGTGATAVALAMHKAKQTNKTELKINVEGGELFISFEATGKGYENIYLKGAASFVFSGTILV